MKENINTSIIIVTWNVEDIIEECLDSYLYFEKGNNEVIIVDNNSMDNTCKIIKEKYKNVKLIELKENIGFSKANNVGLKHSNGEYIFFLNPDVIFIQEIIENMRKKLIENDNIGIISPKLLNVDKTLQISYCNFPSITKIIIDDFKLGIFLPKFLKKRYYQAKYHGKENRFVDWTHGAAHFCRKKDLDIIGWYPDTYFMYGEDTELCQAYTKKLDKKILYMADLQLVHIGGHSESKVINSKKIIYGTNASLYFIKKYSGNFKMYIAKILLTCINFFKYVVSKILYLVSSKTEYAYKVQKFKLAALTALKYTNQVN